MRKRIISSATGADEAVWLDLERLARVELTSEDPTCPIEAAFVVDADATDVGWRAAEPGEQLIRLIFDKPQDVRRILLRCNERERERTQEFCLRWSPDGKAFRELLRQQWNFSPLSANSQLEDFEVALQGLSILELWINPDITGGDSRATLAQLCIA